MKKTLLVLFTTLITIGGFAQNNEAQQMLYNADRHYFIENKGQWHDDVLFLCRMGGLDAWITKYGVNYTFFKIEKTKESTAKEQMPKGKFDQDEWENTLLLGHRVLMKLQNHNPEPQQAGKQKQEGYHNYLIGNDPSKHSTFVGLFKEAIVKNVYNGIDLRYYFDQGSLRYDYIVHPGADPAQIQFTLEGQDNAYLKDGNLYFTTRFGEVAMAELYTYQGDKKIESRFEKQNNRWKINVGNYDPMQDLIIDPLLYSTYLGGSGSEYGQRIAVDGSGNAYVTGNTQSTDYDITVGAFQTTFGGNYDAFVTKLNSTGSGLVYSTYIGGGGSEYGRGIAIDGSWNAYVTGNTQSTDYPITAGAFQTTFSGGSWDVFVTKLNSTGSGLVYSTYLGGSDFERGEGIAVDVSGNAYVTGVTTSTNYDITAGAFQTTFGGGTYDAFVTKLNSTGNGLVYSTYLGGSDFERGEGIAVDVSGNAYLTGNTGSINYDITAGAFQTTFGGGSWDAFVTKLNSTASALLYSTYLGGSSDDSGPGIAVDGSGNAYVTGQTNSTDYPITAGAFQTTFGGGGSDAFVSKLGICSNTTSTISPVVCNSYTSPSGNYTWSTSGTYTDTIPNAAGCDSIITINLTVNNTTTSTISPVACNTYTSPSGNYTWTTSGTYTDTIPNAAGCDSIITINLTVNNTTTSTLSPVVCNSYTSPSGNYTWSPSGTYTDTIPNAAGCDSIITINLTVNQPVTGTDIQTACNSYTWIDGNTYTSSTNTPTYTIPGGAANGCDSIVTLNLTINNATTSTISPVTCNSYTSPSGNYTWSTSGTYTDTIPNTAGCDSIITINLTVNTVDTSVINNDPVLTANATNATYQWVTCPNYAVISGETGQTFTTTANGSYGVIVTQNGCTDTSACQTVASVGIQELTGTNVVRVYPNPTTGKFTIELAKSFTDVAVKITNTLGQLVYQNEFNSAKTIPLKLEDTGKGIYFVRVYSENKIIASFKIKKQ